MVNRYETFDIMTMAEFLKLRRKTQSTTVLFLGSRTGGLFRSSLLYDILRPFNTDLERLLPLQKFSAYFRILDTLDLGDVYEIVRTALNQINIGEADVYVAQLAKRRFFNMLVTTNIDDLLKQAFVWTGMKEPRDFDVLIAKSKTEKSPLTGRKSPFTIIKAFGDLATGEYAIKSRVRHLEAAKNLKEIMDDIRDWNILIVGLDPAWDQHIMRVLFPRNGTVWYVNEESPSEDSALADYLRECKAQCIIGPEGQYEHFFHDLYDLVADSSDPYHPTSNTKQAQVTPTTALLGIRNKPLPFSDL